MSSGRVKGLAPRSVYVRKVALHATGATALIAGSLLTGMAGYHWLEHLPWIDALLNASMIMGGMGPVDPVRSTAGKLFASVYALYCGLLLLVCAGIILAPVLRRFLHQFHLEIDGDARD